MAKQVGKHIAKATKMLIDLQAYLGQTLNELTNEKTLNIQELEIAYNTKRTEANAEYYSSKVIRLEESNDPADLKRLKKHEPALKKYKYWKDSTEQKLNEIKDKLTPKAIEMPKPVVNPVVKLVVNPVVIAERNYDNALYRLKAATTGTVYERQVALIIAYTDNLKNRKLSVDKVTEVLNDTYRVLKGEISPETYRNKAKDLPGLPSKHREGIAFAMRALGVLLLIASVACMAALPFVLPLISVSLLAIPVAISIPATLGISGAACINKSESEIDRLSKSPYSLFKTMNKVAALKEDRNEHTYPAYYSPV